jgi:two-component system, OmpR family, phosphate regulon response regulator PhoB
MTSNTTIGTGTALVVDDDPSLLEFLADNLTIDHVRVVPAASAEEALRLLGDEVPDLAVIDMTLPGMSGIDFVEIIRAGGPDDPWDAHIPILVMSGRDDPHTPVRALTHGADDFLAKPFHYPELLARMDALLRRSRGRAVQTLLVGNVVVDRASHRATVSDQPLDLSAKEFALLAALMRSPDRVVTKEELLRDVWGFIGRGRTRTVDSHASRLRCKLANAGAPGLVANIWGVGYRFSGDV